MNPHAPPVAVFSPPPAFTRLTPQTILAGLAFLAFVSLGLPDGLIGVAWPSVRGEFGLPLDALGLLFASATAGYLVSSFLAGKLLRLLPVGTILALSTAAAATALLGYALAPAWPVMVALGLLAGLGGGAVDASLNAYGAAHFSARILNWLHAFFGLGTTLGPLIVTAVLSTGLSWRWSYLIVGSAQALLALTFFATRKRWKRVDTGDASTPLARTRDTLRRPAVWLGMLVFFVYAGFEMAVGQWSYTLLTLGRGVPEGTAGLFVSGYWGSLMVGRVLFGLVADRVPLAAALRVCLGLALLGAALFWLEPSRHLSLIGLMMMGFFLAPVFASLISLTPARVGAAHASSAIGFQIAAAGLGGALLVAGVGVLARSVGLGAIGGSVLGFAALLLALYEALMRTRTPRAPASG